MAVRITRKDKSAGELWESGAMLAIALVLDPQDGGRKLRHAADAAGLGPPPGRVGPVQPSPAGSTLSAAQKEELADGRVPTPKPMGLCAGGALI